MFYYSASSIIRAIAIDTLSASLGSEMPCKRPRPTEADSDAENDNENSETSTRRPTRSLVLSPSRPQSPSPSASASESGPPSLSVSASAATSPLAAASELEVVAVRRARKPEYKYRRMVTVEGGLGEIVAKLPSDVLLRIFQDFRGGDLRSVCVASARWCHVVNSAPEMWGISCEALDLLPERTDTVLGACAAHVRSQVASVPPGPARNESVSHIYRAHYLRWAREICTVCEPNTIAEFCPRCVHPADIEWVSATIEDNPIPWPPGIGKNIGFIPFMCPHPPHPPLTWRFSARLYRLDHLLNYIDKIISHRETSQFRKLLYSRGDVLA